MNAKEKLRKQVADFFKSQPPLRWPIDFQQAMLFIIPEEGGYVNHPNDPGEETKYGISKRSFPNVNIKRLTLEEAIKLYYKHFYEPIEHRYSTRSLFLNPTARQAFVVAVMDASVNHGRRRANRFVQRAVNMCLTRIVSTQPQKLLKIDGRIGPKTLAALQSVLNVYSGVTFLSFLTAVRLRFYTRLTRLNRKRFSVFLPGWVNRISNLIEFTGSLASQIAGLL